MSGNIGEKIRTVRKDAGLTQTQLAKRMGVTKQTVHLYESCEMNPKIDTVVKFAEALKVPVEYLVSTESDCAHHWVSVKVRLPELDEDEPFARCLTSPSMALVVCAEQTSAGMRIASIMSLLAIG